MNVVVCVVVDVGVFVCTHVREWLGGGRSLRKRVCVSACERT